ncbi:transcription factor [Datura stramonium]|uniref:Transcription factor n=1 Tax=Datura stramonium TaxID=4076 RepID=A0ABS8TK50_DATST|nr:transcription factor [Datura stramonium]
MEGVESNSNRWNKEVEEEEALKWEANHPTNNGIRRGSDDEKISLSMEEKRSLLNRLMNIADEDNDNFLLKLRQRFDRVGLEFPNIEVRFEHLNVEAEAYAGTRALPTMFNFTINMLEGALNYFYVLPKRKKSFSILKDVSGIIKPGRMTLLLGPPGCGKTTLLLALAGKLNSDVKVSGKVSYNGHGMDEFVPERTCAYTSQEDVHLAELTVRETLEFSARCQGVGPRYG